MTDSIDKQTQPTEKKEGPKKESPKKESLLLNLAFNIAIPTLVLTKLSGEDYLGIKLAIIVALSFPIIYGVRDFFVRSKINFFSALGVVSVALTGGISLMELDAIYIAIKEASIPALFGLATLVSLKTSQPLIHTFLLNDSVLEIDKINASLLSRNRKPEFDQLLINASWILAGSFLLSAVLNYFLAVYLLTADPGTQAFNEQLGKMTALSFPVIAVPAMLVMIGDMFYLFKGITRITGLSLEEIIKQK
ncbi:type IV secretion system protein [Porticoccaceae bacterium]|nr:type IV secretion system protein [Porticoccaceae bacterium]MDC1513750.1 type IV secretion system protein [Porticoccaceae bacterium]